MSNLIASLLLLNAIIICIFDIIQCRKLKQLKKCQNNHPSNKHFDDIMRPLLLEWKELEPAYEETDEMGVEHGEFYFIQRGVGGGKRGLICGLTGKHCTEECFKRNALYFSYYGEPLFFCRYYYCLFKGKKYVEHTIITTEDKKSFIEFIKEDGAK